MTTDILGPARHVIRTRYVESVKPYILELTSLTIAAGPKDLITRDLRGDRLIISVDADGFISGLKIA
ncbi:hypothetical protein [Pseudomonas sp. EMN2]|uniref:hypothetical protein n=1 Tax=Pseudomonas sp. EMN2 TaxID=2615212 RepID=UPI00129AF0D8|nr:hypothetical protein [Pseudomonas sp. EMN2]